MLAGEPDCMRCGDPAWVAPRGARAWPARAQKSGLGVAGLAWCAEQAGERRDCLEQQRVYAGLLVGEVAGAELGDGAAVFGLGGELAYPGGDRGADEGRPRHGQSRVSSATAFLAQASSMRS